MRGVLSPVCARTNGALRTVLNVSSLSHFNQPLALALATVDVNFSTTTLTRLNPFYWADSFLGS